MHPFYLHQQPTPPEIPPQSPDVVPTPAPSPAPSPMPTPVVDPPLEPTPAPVNDPVPGRTALRRMHALGWIHASVVPLACRPRRRVAQCHSS
jgi:hypothetical protein